MIHSEELPFFLPPGVLLQFFEPCDMVTNLRKRHASCWEAMWFFPDHRPYLQLIHCTVLGRRFPDRPGTVRSDTETKPIWTRPRNDMEVENG